MKGRVRNAGMGLPLLMTSVEPAVELKGSGGLFNEKGGYDATAAREFLGTYWQKRAVGVV